MTPYTGDWALFAPKIGKANFQQRGIQAMGSSATHGEPVYMQPDGRMDGGCAHVPHFEILPILDRRDRYDIAIYRWHEFAGDGLKSQKHFDYMNQSGAVTRAFHEMKIPYDGTATKYIAWNVVMRIFFPNVKYLHIEHEVYCIENLDVNARASGVNPFAGLHPQKYLALIHCERQVLVGKWVLVQDYGLHDRIMSMGRG